MIREVNTPTMIDCWREDSRGMVHSDKRITPESNRRIA
jgi:hypothetical protein